MPPAKKAAAARKTVTPAKEYADVVDLDMEDDPYEVALTDAAKDLALDFLFKRAFKYGQAAHARAHIEQQKIPDEVKRVLILVAERNAS